MLDLANEREVRPAVRTKRNQFAVEDCLDGDRGQLGQVRSDVPATSTSNAELAADDGAEAVPLQLIEVAGSGRQCARAGEHRRG